MMHLSPLMLIGLLLLVALAVGLFLIAAMSRHHKGATGELELMGAEASVEATLGPQGTVLIRGELWPARARTGATVERGCKVLVVGAEGHLLQVEPIE
ncbi:MAG TPA: NfeD family protein [Pyrinomonadaceae bacterium]|jgi:membrane-bound ClpP family serine protease|nr:NfeD family protein [Pyrinomonadaceae bacterium]